MNSRARISDGSGIRFFVVSGKIFLDGSMRYDASEQSSGNDSGLSRRIRNYAMVRHKALKIKINQFVGNRQLSARRVWLWRLRDGPPAYWVTGGEIRWCLPDEEQFNLTG
ncbi:hypothetical protein MESS4_360001 [Mesorhizobium sp. STM 4661]|nr:hypothetical protein MESS4_360001 [Mesorhizobium sp. STM 4661]